jgi:hypothetical protein
VNRNRGHVVRIDRGTYTSHSESPQYRRLALAGRYVHGIVELRRAAADQSQWTLHLP